MALVMVIEDEEALALLLKYNLEKEGYEVVWEPRGNKALAEIEKHCPSVILLDWMLPEMSGVEICKLIRSKPDIKNINIIINRFQLFSESGIFLSFLNIISKEIRHLLHKDACLFSILHHSKLCTCIQGIKQKMWIDLRLKIFQLSFFQVVFHK